MLQYKQMAQEAIQDTKAEHQKQASERVDEVARMKHLATSPSLESHITPSPKVERLKNVKRARKYVKTENNGKEWGKTIYQYVYLP
jgi:hypothetical protein